MADILNKPVSGKITLLDAFIIAGLKNVEERLMTRVVGNGTLLSGGVKTGLGIVLNSVGSGNGFFGKGINLLGTATIIDGAEDIVNFIMPKASVISLKSSSPSNQNKRTVL